MSSQATSDFRRRRKDNLIKVCESKCALCGYANLSAALEFHHIDPSKKSYGIASQGTCHNLEADLAEIKKCILVCANCHREIHSGLYTEDELYQKQIYNEDFAQFLRDDLFARTGHKEYVCSMCGAKISKNADTGLCASCYAKSTRVVERPNREELKALIRTHTFVELGRIYKISDNGIRKWCKAENLPYRSSEIKNYSDQEWEKI